MAEDSTHRHLTLGELCRVAREGTPDEQQMLFEYLRPHLLRAIRGRLSARLRRWFESCDFEQSVWGSLANLQASNTNKRFICGNDLIAYVCQIARFKIVDQAAHMRTDLEKRRVLPAHDPPVSVAFDESDSRPVEKQVAEILAQEDTYVRDLVEMRLTGVNAGEIAERLGISRAQVYRILERLARRHRSKNS